MAKDIGDFTEPVLPVCPIPRHAIGFIGGNQGSRPRYLLWRDGKEITVEVPYYDYETEYDPLDPFSQWKIYEKSLQTFGHYLEIIQMHLDEIHFGDTNWAYLLQDKFGGFYIRQRQKIFTLAVSCPLWAPTILEDEIQFTVWGQPWDRRGIWKGLEVDVLYAWSEEDIIHLNRAMHASRILAGMDLTFEVYGHLLRSDGTVIGLVSEAAKGRMIRLSDRSLIYRAIATLQARGCLYKGCGTNRFMISPDGKVRLLELFSLTQYPKKQWQKLEKDAELWHWMELDELFQEFKTHGPYGLYRFPPDRFTASPKNLQLIAPFPSPQHPLGGLFLYPSPNFFITYRIPLWDGFELEVWADPEHVDINQMRRRSITAGSDSSSRTDPSSGSDVEDRPLNGVQIMVYRMRRGVSRGEARIVCHPYRANRTRNGVLISSDHTSDSSGPNRNYNVRN